LWTRPWLDSTQVSPPFVDLNTPASEVPAKMVWSLLYAGESVRAVMMPPNIPLERCCQVLADESLTDDIVVEKESMITKASANLLEVNEVIFIQSPPQITNHLHRAYQKDVRNFERESCHPSGSVLLTTFN
jgi:hypothetical protein